MLILSGPSRDCGPLRVLRRGLLGRQGRPEHVLVQAARQGSAEAGPRLLPRRQPGGGQDQGRLWEGEASTLFFN